MSGIICRLLCCCPNGGLQQQHRVNGDGRPVSMIAYLSGIVRKIGAAEVVLDVGGVGYRVLAPANTLMRLGSVGDKASLHIHTSVREDAIELFGFEDELDQQLFEVLITVSGVGSKLALSVLSSMSVRDVASAAQGDGARLQTIPGIGRKTAQRIALEIGEKVQELAMAAAAGGGAQPDVMADVVEGLIALGYSRQDARRVAQDVRKELPDEANAAALLRAALARLNQ